MNAFQPFGVDHWLVLGLTLAGSAGLIAAAPGLRRLRDDRPARVALAGILAANQLAVWAWMLHRGAWVLPLQLCDLVIWLVAWALLGGPRLVAELAFFWGMAGSLQAVLTPDLEQGFFSMRWLTFFTSHVAAVVGAVYLVARGLVRPGWRAIGRVWLATNLYAAAAGLVNWRLGTNFGYLARKPSQPSALDYLGPWPWYLVGMELVAALSLAGCLGVARLAERRAARA